MLEYDGASGALGRWYAFGQGPDAVLGQMNVAAGTRKTMIPDIQGSIIGTLDSGTGALAKSGYQSFGENPSVTTGTYRYTARRFDPETAGSASQPSGLHYYRARTYSPTWGRFLQPDPIGYTAGSNPYMITLSALWYSAVGSATPTGACPRAGRRRDPGDGNGNLVYDGAFTYGYDAESRDDNPADRTLQPKLPGRRQR